MYIVFVIAFFVDNENAALSGMERYVYKISSFLQERGHCVEIVAGGADDRTWKYKDVKIYSVKYQASKKQSALAISHNVLKREYVFQKRLHQINRQKRIDIVQYAGWSGVGCMHSLSCPAILRISTYSKVQYAQHELFANKVHIYSFWERVAGRRVDGVIAPGEILGRRFGEDINKNVTIMETPFSNKVIEDFTVYNDKLQGLRYILFYGSCSTDKGFEVIGDMLPQFFESDKEVKFVCAGWDIITSTGSTVKKIQRKLGKYKERMLYLGLLPQEQLYPIIRHAELVLQPSLIDNLPNSALEALSLGKIVIGTYHTSLEQIISDGGNGFLAEPGNPDSLLEAIDRAYKLSEEQKEKMKIKNKEIIRKYSPDVAVVKLERYYKWILNRKQKRFGK